MRPNNRRRNLSSGHTYVYPLYFLRLSAAAARPHALQRVELPFAKFDAAVVAKWPQLHKVSYTVSRPARTL